VKSRGAVVRGLASAIATLVIVLAISAYVVVGPAAADALSQPAPATRTKINSLDGLTYVWVPAGAFAMGCALEDEPECLSNEQPRHGVTLTRGFWIGQTPVTQSAYGKQRTENPSRFVGESLPVEGVTWEQARAFCRDVGMRLPTEAEWEYAARAGKDEARYGEWEHIAWVRANSNGRTHPVGMKAPNAFGLHDMLGNVWEWVSDRYGLYDEESLVDPQGPIDGDARVLRGGSWNDFIADVRFALRDVHPPSPGLGDRDYEDHTIGFRCAGD
jgi:formylglycine-generating enzyme required for sulfatase activity